MQKKQSLLETCTLVYFVELGEINAWGKFTSNNMHLQSPVLNILEWLSVASCALEGI